MTIPVTEKHRNVVVASDVNGDWPILLSPQMPTIELQSSGPLSLGGGDASESPSGALFWSLFITFKHCMSRNQMIVHMLSSACMHHEWHGGSWVHAAAESRTELGAADALHSTKARGGRLKAIAKPNSKMKHLSAAPD